MSGASVSPVVARRVPWGLVAVRGAEAGSFLQSLVSQDLVTVADGQGVRSLLLSPQGKLDVVFRALRIGDDWWLDCEPTHARQLEASLTRFKLRVDATIEVIDAGLATVLGAGGADLVAAVTGATVPDTPYAHVAAPSWPGGRVVRADWPDRPAVDVLGEPEVVDGIVTGLRDAGGEPLDDAGFEAARIEAGIPRLGVDVDDRTIPQEAFLERDAVSFTKGCFLGQELVTRIDTRGHVNRYLRRLSVDGVWIPPVGSEVVAEGREVGIVTSVAVAPDGRVVALAMVRREVEPPASVQVRSGAGSASAELERTASGD